MNKTLLVTFLLCAAFSCALADFKYTTKSFANEPVKIIDTDDDDEFQGIALVSRFIDDSKIVLWGFTGDDNTPAVYSAKRRFLNSSSLEKVGKDYLLDLSIESYDTPVFSYSTNGYIAAVGTGPSDDNKNVRDLYIYVFSSNVHNGDAATKLSITNNDNKKVDYKVGQVWFQDDYFYVVYVAQKNGDEQDIYLQGYFATDANTTKFNTPVKLNTEDLTGPSSVQCAQVARSEHVVCAWRQENQKRVVSIQVDLKEGIVQDEVVAITDADGKTIVPTKVIAGDDYYIILLNQVSKTGLVTKLSVRGTNDKAAIGLKLDLPTGFTSLSVSDAAGIYDGWFIITRTATQPAKITLSTDEVLQVYDSSSNSNGTAKTLVSDGRIVQGFTLPNQSYYVFFVDTKSGDYDSGYLGQVFDKIHDYNFGSIMKSAVATMVAFVAVFIAF